MGSYESWSREIKRELEGHDMSYFKEILLGVLKGSLDITIDSVEFGFGDRYEIRFHLYGTSIWGGISFEKYELELIIDEHERAILNTKLRESLENDGHPDVAIVDIMRRWGLNKRK